MLGCGECDKGFVIMDEVKYPRLAERLKEPVPAERSERAREFVTDLAVGYEDKAWGAGLSFISDSEGKSPARIIRSNRSLSDDEEQRWTTNEVSVNIERMIYIFQPDGYDEMDADCIKALKNKWEQHNLGRDDINNAVIQGLLKAVSKVQFFLTPEGIKLAHKPKISPTIFISYKHGTCAPLAKLIANQIACTTNAKPFLDESREVSEDLDEGFEQEIERCVAFIGVIRADTLSDDSYVRTEIQLAVGAKKQLAFIWHDGYTSEQPNGQAPDELKARIDGLVAIPVEGKSAGAYSHAIEKLLRELCNNNEYLCYEYNPDWLE